MDDALPLAGGFLAADFFALGAGGELTDLVSILPPFVLGSIGSFTTKLFFPDVAFLLDVSLFSGVFFTSLLSVSASALASLL